MNIVRLMLICTGGVLLTGCQPSSDPSPDIVKAQREALGKAKAVEGQVQKAAEEQRKAADQQAEK